MSADRQPPVMRAVPESGDARQRILFVSARFEPFVGGTEIHTKAVAAELAARGHDVTVLTTDTSRRLPPTEIIDGIEVIRERAWRRMSDAHFAPRLAKHIDARQWDVVHVQGYHTAVAPLALRAAQRRGLPTVLTFHSGGHASSVRNMLRPVHIRVLRSLVVGVDQLIAVSDFEADLFARRLNISRKRIAVIPNGVASVPKPTATRTLRAVPEGDHPVILSIGRFVRYKGHQRVVEALPFLLEADPRTELYLIGSGPYEAKLRDLVARLGLTDRVTFEFIPSDERERLQALMERASLAMLLSDYESHGMAAHEALDAGLPLLVANRTALGELVTAGLATAVPPKATPREVAAIALRTLALDASAAEAAPRPSWAEISDALEDTYASILGT